MYIMFKCCVNIISEYSEDAKIGEWTSWSCNSKCYNPDERRSRVHKLSRSRTCKGSLLVDI